MSRLPAGPETDRMEVPDIESGHFVFRPLPDEPIRHAGLLGALDGAGYEMTEAWLAAAGRLTAEGRLEALETGQAFVLVGGAELERLREVTTAGDTVSVYGAWTSGAEADTVAIQRWATGTEVSTGSGQP